MTDAVRQRALRKQALLLRSATERAELIHTVAAVRHRAGGFGKGVPGLGMLGGLPLALGLLKRAPLLKPLLSLLLAGARRPVIRYGALAAGASWLLWKSWQGLAARNHATVAKRDAPAEGAESVAQDATE